MASLVPSVRVPNATCGNRHAAPAQNTRFPLETAEPPPSTRNGEEAQLLVPKAWSPEEPISLHSASLYT